MATSKMTSPATLSNVENIAVRVSAEEYMQQYAEAHYEWVQGVLLPMSLASILHCILVGYLHKLLDAYFDMNPTGRVIGEPFVMRLESVNAFREPDLQIILHDNPGKLTDTAMIGPADICIEVVSPESAPRDYGDKFVEYEKAGVRDYWIFDPIRQRSQFNRLDASGIYVPVLPDEAGIYRTPLLPKLTLHVPTLWQEHLPGFFAIGEAVRAMFRDA